MNIGVNPKGLSANTIWQMDVTQYPGFGKLKYIHHSVDTYSHFSWATPLSSEKADAVITHLLEAFAVMGIPDSIKTDNASAYHSQKCQTFFATHNIQHVTGIPGNSTGQAVIERQNRTLKDMLIKQKGGDEVQSSRKIIHIALFTLNFLNHGEDDLSAADRHWTKTSTQELSLFLY